MLALLDDGAGPHDDPPSQRSAHERLRSEHDGPWFPPGPEGDLVDGGTPGGVGLFGGSEVLLVVVGANLDGGGGVRGGAGDGDGVSVPPPNLDGGEFLGAGVGGRSEGSLVRGGVVGDGDGGGGGANGLAGERTGLRRSPCVGRGLFRSGMIGAGERLYGDGGTRRLDEGSRRGGGV